MIPGYSTAFFLAYLSQLEFVEIEINYLFLFPVVLHLSFVMFFLVRYPRSLVLLFDVALLWLARRDWLVEYLTGLAVM